MAELASGAVTSLLGLIRNEALLLRRVGGDVQFIKEEMESMNSFLGHLARTVPPGGEHDEQVRTWMKQVRDLAHDCSNCIDLYLQRGNPAVHHARGGLLRRYILLAHWFVQKMIAQRNASIRLRELKERARDVGQRRLRYGVEVPRKAVAEAGLLPSAPGAARAPFIMSSSSSSHAAAAEEDDEDDEDEDEAVMEGDISRKRRRALGTHTLEDYCAKKLDEWLKQLEDDPGESVQSIAIVVPEDTKNHGSIAREATSAYLEATRHFEDMVVYVDIPAVHLYFLYLRPLDILFYILRELEPENYQSSQQQCTGQGDGEDQLDTQFKVYREKWKLIREITGQKQREMVQRKIGEIKSKIDEMTFERLDMEGQISSMPPSGQLLLMALLLLTGPKPEPSPEQVKNDAISILSSDQKRIIRKTAKKLKQHMEEGGSEDQTSLHLNQYEGILQDIFPTSTAPQEEDRSAKKATKTTSSTATASSLGEDQINEIVRKVKLDILRELLPSKQQLPEDETVKKQTAGKLGQEQTKNAINETKEKIEEIESEIEHQMQIKGIMDKIEGHLENKRTLVILKDDKNYISTWDETRSLLSLLGCMAGVVIVTTTDNIQTAKGFCHPPREPITYSLVGLYHDIALQLTSELVNNEDDNCNPQILRKILEKCDPHEFCMKILVHALYAKPNRSNEELERLHRVLQASQKPLGKNAKKMFKFSYNDLPKEYKSCLLYLAIFPKGHSIRRSTIVGRWVTEGLITAEDWSSAVYKAERCFDALIDRLFVDVQQPCDIGATGKAKSCTVDDPVHGIITKIAKKQHIVETRLSHHLAHHFSIFNDLRLRGSDSIDTFFQKLSESPQWSLLKVLDLEKVQGFKKNQRYIKDTCSKILLLKYLSLRRTDVTKLPNEINNLYELEVLDIRETMVPMHATKSVLLLKLKRLLAGHTGMPKTFSSVQIPRKIEKMENMEVLSNVEASQAGHELKEIGKLFQLRKLGVVIKDNRDHFKNLLRAISDLHECLESLSITLPSEIRRAGTTSSKRLPDDIFGCLKERPPKHLESLSISGTTHGGQLLPHLANSCDKLTKVTLCNTQINQDSMKELTRHPKLRCVRLQGQSYTESTITFTNDGFQCVKYLIFDNSDITKISFEDRAAPQLEKIVVSSGKIDGICFKNGAAPELQEIILSATNIISITIENEAAPILKKIVSSFDVELKLCGSRIASALHSIFNNGNKLAKVTVCDTLLNKHGLQILAKQPDMQSLRLMEKSCEESELTFNKDELQKLELLEIKCFGITKVNFEDKAATQLKKIVLSCDSITSIGFKNGAAPKLEEIILSSSNIISITSENGATPILKKIASLSDVELELNGSRIVSTLHSLFSNADKLSKVTLHDTMIKRADLQILAKQPNLQCLVLMEKSCDESQLTFNKDEFQNLKLLIVKCTGITKTSFAKGAAPKLEKIAWSFTKMESLSGIKNLLVLRELELNGEGIPDQVRKDIAEHPVLKNEPLDHCNGIKGEERPCPAPAERTP